MTTLTTSIQHHIGSPSQHNKQEKETAHMLGRKKQNCFYLWMTRLHMYKILKESIRNLLELISTFSKMTECKYAKFNTCFLAVNNWKLKLKI